MKDTFSDIKTISLRTLNITMTIVAGLLAACVLYSAWLSFSNVNVMVDSTKTYFASQKHAATLIAGSDYLTEQVLAFAVTGDKKHVDLYFKEVHENKSRDKALQNLELFFAQTDAYNYLRKAMERSNALMEREFRSIRLVAEATGQDLSLYPQEIQKFVLDQRDERLADEEKKALACELLVGEVYSSAKEKIRADVYKCIDMLVAETQNKQEDSAGLLRKVMLVQFSLIAGLLVVLLLFVIANFLFVIRPLRKSADYIYAQQELPENGVCEMKYFARSYNTLFRLNKEHRRKLSYESEHDALTGLYNRSSFDRLRAQHEQRSIALLLLEVDKFNTFDKEHGRDMGEKILKKVAHLLTNSFREEDYLFRIGASVFAVIMVYAKSELKPVVERKMILCSTEMNNPTDGLPKVSLSIGIAFNDREGGTGNIYRDANTALEAVKEKGGNSIAFYGANTAAEQ